MGHEGTKEIVFALQRPAMMPRGVYQRVQFKGREVGKWVHFQVAPNVLHRIEFWGVGWQKMGMQASLLSEEVPRGLAAVGLKAIPNQNDGAGQLLQQHAQKIDGCVRIDVCVGVK